MRISQLSTGPLSAILAASLTILGCDGQTPTQPSNTLQVDASFALSNFQASAIAPGVLAWWPGDGNSVDIVGGNDGTLRNGATFATGKVQQAFSFDGNDDFVDGTAPTLPQGSTPRTYDAWIFPDKVTGVQTIFNYGTFVFNQRNGMLLFENKLYFVGEFNDVIGNIPIRANEWTHVAIALSGSTINLYVNGTLDKSATLPSGPHNTTGTSWAIGKGFRGTADPEWFDGLIDEVVVYGRVLSASEIETIFNAGIKGNKPKITVELCHKPGTRGATSVVPFDALADHLAHGDALGACS